jgi:hypothetical protein
MSGCAGIAVVAFISYTLAVVPWFLVPDYRKWGLYTAVGLGAGTSAVFGAAATARLKLAGAAGFVGGALASALFMYLRLQHSFSGKIDPRLPDPEYPEAFAAGVPLAWGALAFLLGAAYMKIFRCTLKSG